MGENPDHAHLFGIAFRVEAGTDEKGALMNAVKNPAETEEA